MTLEEIIWAAREHLDELTVSSVVQNIHDDFESYTVGAIPTTPWVASGTYPRVQTVGSGKMLQLEGSGYSGTVGIDISTQIPTESKSVHIMLDLYRTVSSTQVVNLLGINEISTLNSTADITLLKIAATNPYLAYNTEDGWKNSTIVISVLTTYRVELYLYASTYDLWITDVTNNGSRIQIVKSRAYPGRLTFANFGYLWFPANSHATATTFINDLNSIAQPAIVGETKWTDVELGRYANEGVVFFRQVLPDKVFDAQKVSSASTTTNGVALYQVPSGMQRLIGVTLNGFPVSIIDVSEHMFFKSYLSNHYLLSGLASFPTGWLYGGNIQLYPVPTGTVPLVFYYLDVAEEMDVTRPSNEVPALPSDLNRLLVMYVVMKAKAKYSEDTSNVRADMEAMTAATSAKYYAVRGIPKQAVQSPIQ